MTLSARDYLIDRFRSDALVLRERAEALAKGQARPGPDAATSRRMADACDDVSAMLQAIAVNKSASATLEALQALVPLLEQRAQQQSVAAVRSVYAGAATRIREVRQAEAQALPASDASGEIDDDEPADDEAGFDVDEIDDDLEEDDDPLPPLIA